MLHTETSAYTTAYRTPAVYFYLIDFSMMFNWNIVCNTNIHYVLKYGYDILMNNIYTQKSVSLKPLCIDAAYGDRCVTGSYLYLFAAVYNYNARIGYTKLNTTIIITT